jgi:hypothetical protein
MGPFLKSAEILDGSTLRFGGGIITVGNEWNRCLDPARANIAVTFGVANGAD